MKAAAIIVAAGSGKRFGGKTPKQFLDLCGKPVFLWSVEAFASLKVFKQIVLVTPKQFVGHACSVIAGRHCRRDNSHSPLPYLHSSLSTSLRCSHATAQRQRALLFEVIEGGRERFNSVRNGLKLIDKSIDFVAIHDAARPLITKQEIIVVLRAAKKTGAAIAAEKTKDTIKTAIGGFVKNTLDRSILWNVQTPQIFEAKLLKKAYSKAIAATTTDDSALVEKLGAKVSIVETKSPNFKITGQNDFNLAENILKAGKHKRRI